MEEEKMEIAAGPDPFATFVGRLVRIAYTDGVPPQTELKVRKGRLLSSSQGFVTLRTHVRTYLIAKNRITEVREAEEEEGRS